MLLERQTYKPLVMIFALTFFLTSCVSSRTADNRFEKQFDPTRQTYVTPTPFLDTADQKFVNEWKDRYVRLKGEIESHRRRWVANKFFSYSFVAAKYRGGHTSPWNRSPVLISVVNGQAVSKELVDQADVSVMGRTDGFEEFDTVDKLFDYMQSELDSGRIVTAKYDRILHYPSSVWITEWIGPHGGRSIAIDNLKVLK